MDKQGEEAAVAVEEVQTVGSAERERADRVHICSRNSTCSLPAPPYPFTEEAVSVVLGAVRYVLVNVTAIDDSLK